MGDPSTIGKERPKGQGPEHTRSKETYLYIAINDPIHDGSNIREDLNHRIGNPLSADFEIVELTHNNDFNEGSSLATIRLPSYHKASAVRNLLNMSNRHFKSKVKCCFMKDEAQGKTGTDVSKEEVDRRLSATLVELLDSTKECVNKHDDKIRDVQTILREIGSKLSDKHGVSLDMFETFTNERLAREDKLIELERQRSEFTRHVMCMKTKITELRYHKKFENQMRDIRKAFGIECNRLKTALPMYARRDDIVSTVRDNQVSVILGETGSGKSTQMVQFLYQAGFADDGLIACTQPRKIAAVSLATHVSSELASSVGQIVGYQVGMQSKKTTFTKVLFMTDHILLNECLRDGDLSTYSCILIDEAHERSIYTDLLLGMLKKCLAKRPELRVVITSATINPDVFVTYFGGPEKCPVLKVSGRTFPVEVFWDAGNNESDMPFPEDFENKALKKSIETHTEKAISDGDILVFLTSPLETERCCENFKKNLQGNDFQCLQLHGRLKPEEQQLVFAPNPKGRRKIVFATNSAETSITIPGIKFVIDTGVAKEMRYDPKKNTNSLDVVPVSQSSADQRKGRAGRTDSGICYRLYSEEEFNRMDKSGTPEILRIHLGQGILKLMELGVNPMSFDFVQAPATGAMEVALETLVDIGAVEGTSITQMGKWISKLPVEPRLGALIKRGIDEGVPTEAILIAASSSQSGVFFRTGSPEEKKNADMKKVRFCHKGGDLLTLLCVFREWEQVIEKCKGKWCQENCINGKTMKGIRDMMNETLSTLRKEANLNIKHEFRHPEEADAIVQKLIFHCLKSNVCYYLGHENAGYVTVERLQHVQLHPSSSLLSLGLQPKWLVYSQLLKTSADFITNVTPVPDDLMDIAIREKLVNIDKEELEKRQINQVLKIPIAKQMYWKFVGPMHKQRREIEYNIRRACNNTVVILEADKLRSEITLYCVPTFKADAVVMLEDSIRHLSEYLLYESKEEPIGNESSGVRALLRKGGSVASILTPQQFRSMNIKQTNEQRCDLTEDGVLHKLSTYGKIEHIQKFRGRLNQQQQFWGKVTFVNEQDTVQAVQEINSDETLGFSVVPITYISQRANVSDGKTKSQAAVTSDFTMKLRWCRRPAKDICFVCLTCPGDLQTILLASPLIINNRSATVAIPNKAKGESDLFIKGLDRNVTDEHVKEALFRALNLTAQETGERFKVKILRETVLIGQDEMARVREKLTQVLSQIVPTTAFGINIKEYKQQNVYCTAYVKFSDAEECSKAAIHLANSQIDGNLIDVTNEFQTSLFLTKKVYEVTKTDIDAFLEVRRLKRSTTSVQMHTLKSGSVSINISAKSLERLAKIKVSLGAIVDGDVRENIIALFSRDGKQKMREIEKTTGAVVFVDDRMMKVRIQGSIQNRAKAVALIDEYIILVATALQREMSLKAEGNPPGLMKAILIKYGIDLETLRKDTGLVFISLNLRTHRVTMTGSDAAIQNTIDAFENIKEEVSGRRIVQEEDFNECPVCLCPIETSDLCQLEYCGHSYCKVCLTSMFQSSIQDKQFPIICAAERCGKAVVMRDINTQIKQDSIKPKQLTDAAVGCFVDTYNSEFKFCITPDCDMIYHVTSEGKPFICSLCQTTICTSCDMPFHDGYTCAVNKGAKDAGVTCAMYKSALDSGMTYELYKSTMDSDNNLEKWIKDDPQNRKRCPKCKIAIEKNEGCNRMSCKCKAHICWLCLQYFDTAGDCYAHLSKEHGSYF